MHSTVVLRKRVSIWDRGDLLDVIEQIKKVLAYYRDPDVFKYLAWPDMKICPNLSEGYFRQSELTIEPHIFQAQLNPLLQNINDLLDQPLMPEYKALLNDGKNFITFFKYLFDMRMEEQILMRDRRKLSCINLCFRAANALAKETWCALWMMLPNSIFHQHILEELHWQFYQKSIAITTHVSYDNLIKEILKMINDFKLPKKIILKKRELTQLITDVNFAQMHEEDVAKKALLQDAEKFFRALLAADELKNKNHVSYALTVGMNKLWHALPCATNDKKNLLELSNSIIARADEIERRYKLIPRQQTTCTDSKMLRR